ncbi:dihydrofolate reductase family protein [Alsobacter sp. SYSU M60028]|uniref:Dihydrofolate reductase family protein n=1 Tax=Alsobacter ponti TaxID=2962936 RepID=A0ABT1L7Z4_9HYPH|nr:dihydrofolate reductase family protein [Alsobacter ponti]MCP8937602.1 dihydrofolate reductase family protein [Alsobacter ponti]
MGSLVLSVFVSLDGYMEMPNGQFRPPAWSDDLATHWSGYALGRARHLVYGRVNFLFNKAFWMPAATDKSSPAAGVPHAATMNSLPKTVFSRTLSGDPGWNARLAGPDLPAEIARLKREVDGDIFAFGGASLANALMRADVVDEYFVMVLPELWGEGRRLFEPGRPEMKLKLLDTRSFDTGAVALRYARDRAEGAAP